MGGIYREYFGESLSLYNNIEVYDIIVITIQTTVWTWDIKYVMLYHVYTLGLPCLLLGLCHKGFMSLWSKKLPNSLV